MKRKWAKTVKANPAYTAKQQARTAAMIGLIVSTGATHLILTKPGGESAPVDRSLVQEPMNKVIAKAQVRLAGGNVNLVEPKAKTQVTVPVISKSLTITPPVERQKTVFIPAPSVIEPEQTRQTPDQLAKAASIDTTNLSNTPPTKTLPSSVATVIETSQTTPTQTQAKLLQVLRVNRLVRQLKQSQAVATNSGFETINRQHIVSPAVTASSGIETETVPAIGEAKSNWTTKQTLLIDRLKQKERLEDSLAQLKFKSSKSSAIINKKKLISSLQNQETHSQTAKSLGLLPGGTPTSSNQNNSAPSSPATVFVIPAITPTNNQVVVPGVVSRVNTGQNKAIALKLGLPLAVTKTNHLDNPNSQPTSVLTSNTQGKNINQLPIAVVPPVNISNLGMGGDISDDVSVSASPPPNVEQIQQAQSAAAQALLSNQYVQWQTDIQKLRQKYPTEGVLITQVPSRNQTDTAPATARTNQKLLRLIPPTPQPINPEFADSQAAKTLQPNDRKQQHIRVRVRDGLATAPSSTDAASLRSVQEQNVSPALPPLGGVDNYLPKPISVSAYGLIWPARGKLTSGYGWRWGRMHKGVDIAAPIGTPIMAAAPGVVVKAGWSSGGYGNMVDIQHKDGTLTRYAHNKRLLVQAGEVVEQGQQISEMGSTGFSTGPHLHFEVRPMGKKAVNPIAYLPR